MDLINLSADEILNFLMENGIYPRISIKGKPYLMRLKKDKLSADEISAIMEKLNLKTEQDCKNIRKKISEYMRAKRENLPIKQWVKCERPREMLLKNGAKNLNLSKLLAIILSTGKEGQSAEELAKILLNKFGSLRVIDEVSISEIRRVEGIGIAKACQIKASLEIGKRFYEEKAKDMKKIKSPDDAIDFVSEYYGGYLRDAKKEFFNIILLDIKNKIIRNIEISKGSIDTSVVDIKEIIKEATAESASSIILVHNHPSGETEPSLEDINLTNRIVDACKIFGIKVLDHIIIGKNKEDYLSFERRGLIK